MANETPLSELVTVRSRFTRSVSLSRDWSRGDALDGYILTPGGRDILGRLAAAVRTESPNRAWSLTGPYGSGKSAFALYASTLLGGKGKAGQRARDQLKELDNKLWKRLFHGKGSLAEAGLLCPVLVTGSREALEGAIAAALLHALRDALGKPPRPLVRALEEIVSGTGNRTTALVAAFEESVRLVSAPSIGYQGLVLVIDEFGKFLEHAANHPDDGDVFALQSLAEAAAGYEQPFLIVTILHQSIDRYAANMSSARRQEWSKIRGRFEDVAFEEPTEQMLRLMAKAIEPIGTDVARKPLRKASEEAAKEAWALEARVGGLDKSDFVELVAACTPLHPTVSLVLGPLFRRLAQNERSLFSFLTSGEPFGFQEFVRKHAWSAAGGELYRLDVLYDYVTTALGGSLYSQHRGKIWSEVQSVLERLHKTGPLEARVAKAIGLMQALGYSAGVPASREVLRFAFAGTGVTEAEVDAAITALEERSVIVFRRHANSYALWEGSDVNIAARVEEGRRAVDPNRTLTAHLADLAPPRPLVARKHSYRTGTLRFFEVVYADRETLPGLITKDLGEADGRVIYCLPLNADDRTAMEAAITAAETKERPAVIAALPKELFDLKEACVELACLKWVAHNTPELAGDATARRELRARHGAAETTLTDQLRRIFAPDGEAARCRWFRRGEPVKVPSARALHGFLSDVCDEVYQFTPLWRNELLNRRSLSSSAAAAQRDLLEAMIERHDKESLGIEGFPPERSMYESILHAPGLHREKGGKWGFHKPGKKDEGLLAVWKRIETFLTEHADQKKPVSELFRSLSAPPFGLKDGVLPVLFVAALLYYDTEAALYEEGSFVPVLTIPVIERLCHDYRSYEVQYCRVSGPRAIVFNKYAAMLTKPEEAADTADTKPKLLKVVRPLVKFVRQLPDYVGNTREISEAAQGVYKAIKETREPDQLLFTDLPKACGHVPFTAAGADKGGEADAFFGKLRLAMVELQQAYPKLQAVIEQVLFKAFGLSAPLPQARNELTHRARLVSELAVEAKLKSFLVRALDDTDDNAAWLESLAALLGGKPPQVWNDQERARFEVNTALMARTFHHFEALAFEVERTGAALLDGDAHAIRVAVTVPHSEEIERVVRIPAKLSERAGKAQEDVRRMLDESGMLKDRDLTVAVLAQLVRQLLSEGGKTKAKTE